jgi:Tfp pilus assembly protein PilX
MRISTQKERGSVLVTTLIITGLVTITVLGLLAVTQQQNYLSARSATWCSEIPIAEAGIEEALAHLNSRPNSLTNHGWTKTASNYWKSRAVGTNADYFYTVISTSRPPTIVSIGYGAVPKRTNSFTQRKVMVMTSEKAGVYGIVASGTIKIGYADSYNSSDPNFSTGGRYDAAKRGDHAGVATLSTAKPAIDAGNIYGFVSVGTGGTAIGDVGDGGFMATSSGIQAGHFRDDYNTALPTVDFPATTWATPVYLGGVYLIGAGDYKIDAAFVTKIKVLGKARVWITGEVKMTGGDEITIVTGASLDLYLSKNATFGGNGIVNGSGTAASCRIYGLDTCTDIKFAGNTALTAQLVAPNADVHLGGTPDVYGSIAAKTIHSNGNAGIHYDESLGTTTDPIYSVVSWEEL